MAKSIQYCKVKKKLKKKWNNKQNTGKYKRDNFE